MTKKKTLIEDGIRVARPLGRRGALAAIFATTGLVGALGRATAAAQGNARATSSNAGSKASDSDSSDAPGHGRTGFTDRDSGPGADGAGRGVCPERGWSDSDPTDPAGRGRGPCH